jgi:hypothetical protein
MYKFTVDYYYQRYHTGAIDESKTRKAVVFANNSSEAIKKVREVDRNFIRSSRVGFEEMESERE